MIMVRIVAVLVLIAVALALLFLWKRDRRYLRWAWRIFLLAAACMVGLMGFYFVERVLLVP